MFFFMEIYRKKCTWSEKIGEYLVTSGFQTSDADFSLYVKKTDHGIIVIVIYVDDLIIT
jgi:hypothetical protein